MVGTNIFHENSTQKNDKNLIFKSEGGSIDEKVPENILYFEEDFTPRSASKWSSRYCSLKMLYVCITIFLVVFIASFKYQMHAETVKNVDLQRKFRDFNAKFGRKYENSMDFKSRFAIFKKNFQDLKNLKLQYPNVEFDENKFMDWSDLELKSILIDEKTYKSQDFSGILPTFNGTLQKLQSLQGLQKLQKLQRPDYIDWRNNGKVMSVKDQGQCGSCWAFATVSAVESQFAIKQGTLWSLSEQELLDCDGKSFGCGGGYIQEALRFVLGNGLETESDYPYQARKNDQCYINGGKTRVRIDHGYILAKNEDSIADWVANVGPVSFVMSVPKSFAYYRNGIYSPSDNECNNESMGYHAMTIIGYGNENGQNYWIIKNSWGNSWGDQGYLRMARGQNICGMTNQVVGPKNN